MSYQNVYRLFRPYFSISKKNIKQWTLLGLLIFGNICQALLIVLLNTSFSHFFGVLNLPVITYRLLFYSIAQYLLVLFIYTLSAFANSYIAEKLTYHLYNVMSKTFLNRWFLSKAYYRANFLEKQKISNVATKLSHDILEANKNLFSLTNNLLNTVFGFCVGIYGLWQLSIPLQFSIGASIFVLPGYMMFAAVVYALFYNFSVNKIGKKLEKIIAKQRQHVDEIEARIHHIEKYAEPIELLNASNKEKEALFQALKKGKIYNNLLAKLNASLAFFVEINTQLRFFSGALLNIPQIIAKTISVDNLFIVSDYFYRVVSGFTWKDDNFTQITTLGFLAEKLNDLLQNQMHESEMVNKQKDLSIEPGKEFGAKDLIIKKPDGSVIIAQENLEFKKGAFTIIEGPSGAGKTTFFRVLGGLWPYVSGKLVLPVERDKMHVIPQQIFFPLCASLYEAILYPQTPDLTDDKIKEIDQLLTAFNLQIDSPNRKANWSAILSGGEQQRIALIRCILSHPLIVLMDESFSALDKEMREKCVLLFRHYLPESTIVCIAHHSLSDEKSQENSQISNRHIYVENKKLVEHPCSPLMPERLRRRALASSF